MSIESGLMKSSTKLVVTIGLIDSEQMNKGPHLRNFY